MSKRFTIRPLGKTSWAEADTWDEACRLKQEAMNRMSGDRIVIYDKLSGDVVVEKPVDSE